MDLLNLHDYQLLSFEFFNIIFSEAVFCLQVTTYVLLSSCCFRETQIKGGKMYDKIIKQGKSQLQHGVQNDRIYLMDLANEDMPEILDVLDAMSTTYGYSKIFAKVPQSFSRDFEQRGYAAEAVVPGFYMGSEDCIFMGKYKAEKRSRQVDQELNEKIIKIALSKKPTGLRNNTGEGYTLPKEFSFKRAMASDAEEMSHVYAKVFDSYPFPVFDPAYIRETMEENFVYFSIWKDHQMIALSSCEMYTANQSVEMTDFAVLPEYRGEGLSCFLLKEMEKEMKGNNIKTAYTIARSTSYGMNSTFAKCGYDFTGTLVKNTQIGGAIEDMNVWYKSLE